MTNYKVKTITFNLRTGRSTETLKAPVRVTEGGQLEQKSLEDVLYILWELSPTGSVETWMLVNDGIGAFEYCGQVHMATYAGDVITVVQI